jgi:hypothetical protein
MRLDEEMVRIAEERAAALEASQGQSAINGQVGWRGLFNAAAAECDALREMLAEKAAAHGAHIALPEPLGGLGPLRTYAGRAGRIEGLGDMCTLLSDLASVADDFRQACVTLSIPSDRLPPRDRGSWTTSCAKLVPENRFQMFLALFARGLLDLGGVIESWRAVPVEAPAKQRRRV